MSKKEAIPIVMTIFKLNDILMWSSVIMVETFLNEFVKVMSKSTEFLKKYSKKSEIYKLLVLKYWVKFSLSKKESNDLPNCDLFNILSKNLSFD
jgi:hypothetical protein